jgi:hypothetical protein
MTSINPLRRHRKDTNRARGPPPTQRDSWATDTATRQKRKPAESLRDPTGLTKDRG